VSERAADARDQQVPYGVLEHAPVFRAEDILQVFLVGLASLAEGHVAGAAGDFVQNLGRDARIGGEYYVFVREETRQLLFDHGLASQEVNLRFRDVS